MTIKTCDLLNLTNHVIARAGGRVAFLAYRDLARSNLSAAVEIASFQDASQSLLALAMTKE